MKIIGIMTGTSMDGIDVALVDFKSKIDLLHFKEYKFPVGYKEKIKSIIKNPNLPEISTLDHYLAFLFAEKIELFLEDFKIQKNEITAVGIHGQTVWHQPKSIEFLGAKIPSTLQLCNIAVLSTITNMKVIGDFRSADIAMGGQGAPLVPKFDYDFFKSATKNRVILNIGGISNLTILNKEKSEDEVIAFDTGPGNCLIDDVAKRFLRKEYDEDGKLAKKGKILNSMFSKLLDLDYFKIQPPKSTGREVFNLNLIQDFINEDSCDLLRTLTELTATTIADNVKNYSPKCEELIISGGGYKNSFLIELIESKLESVNILSTDDFGLPTDAKEAVCFAYLAYLHIKGKTGNLPKVTGSSKKVILGVSSI